MIRAMPSLACSRARRGRVCAEFRNHTWMTGDNQDESLSFLREHDLPTCAWTCRRATPGSIRAVLAATSDLALVRMNGHADKWTSKSIAERFGYWYSDEELTEWATRSQGLAGEATDQRPVISETHPGPAVRLLLRIDC
jgi:uncharacterized protein YecE (DUF72 family)